MNRSRWTALLVLAVVTVVAACGAEVHVGTRPKKLEGAAIASRANTQLEKENPKLVHGDLTCADVKFALGATSQCVRTVVLPDGRMVRIGATVTIDRVTGGGHFKIKVDDTPQEFGLTGASVLKILTQRYAAKNNGTAPTGSCPPFLAGKVGTTMTCKLTFTDGSLDVRVTVTKVDPRTFGTAFSYESAR